MGQPIRIDAPTQGQVLQPDLPPSKRYFEKWSNLTPEQQKKSGSKAEHRKKRIEEGLRLPHQEANDLFTDTQDEPFQGPVNEADTRSSKSYFNEFDPGKRIGKSEMKGAVDAGVSYQKINKYIEKTGAKATQGGSKFLARKLGEVSTKIKHYDPTTVGNEGFTKKDVEYLMSEEGGNYSAQKVKNLRDKYVEEGQIRVGANTQKHIDRIGGRDNNQPIETQPVDETSKPKDKPNKKTPKLSKAQQISNDMRVRSNLSNQMMFGDSPLFF